MGQSPTWGCPAPQVQLQRQFWVVQMPRAATPPGESKWKVVWNRAEIPLGWVNMHAYNFPFVWWPKFTDFLSSNLRCVVVDHLLFRFSIRGSVPEIFTIKVDSCQKSRQVLDVFALPNFRGRAFPKCCAHVNTPALGHVAWKSFVTLLPLAPKLQARTQWILSPILHVSP